MPEDINSELPKFFLFGVVGAIATLAHYITLILLVEVGDVSPVVSTSAGFAVGALVNYILNHRYTFKSNKAHLDAAPIFFSIALITGLLNAILVYWGLKLLAVHYLIVQVFATLITFLANFMLNSNWTFRKEKVS